MAALAPVAAPISVIKPIRPRLHFAFNVVIFIAHSLPFPQGPSTRIEGSKKRLSGTRRSSVAHGTAYSKNHPKYNNRPGRDKASH
jgi:hypothetical protein